MIGRKYVCDHLYPCPNNGEINNKGILNSKFFYLINIEDIFTYGKEIEL